MKALTDNHAFRSNLGTCIGEFPKRRNPEKEKMKNWSQTAEYLFMQQFDWLKFEIE